MDTNLMFTVLAKYMAWGFLAAFPLYRLWRSAPCRRLSAAAARLMRRRSKRVFIHPYDPWAKSGGR